MLKKLNNKISTEKIYQDCERYTELAMELGATDARVIPASDVVLDERVRLKCFVPACARMGDSANCPPSIHERLSMSMMKNAVDKFNYAVFFKLDVPSNELAGPDVLKERRNIPSAKQCHEIVSKIESRAFYDGYYLAMGFANGPCKSPFCPTVECQALQPGKNCRHPLKARPAMEAVGMDAFQMSMKVGWDVYPVGKMSMPCDVPHGNAMGLVLIH